MLGRTSMVTYVVLAKFTDQGIRNAKDSPKRAEAVQRMAQTFGVTVKEIFWTQGRYDIVTIVGEDCWTNALIRPKSSGRSGSSGTAPGYPGRDRGRSGERCGLLPARGYGEPQLQDHPLRQNRSRRRTTGMAPLISASTWPGPAARI